MSASLRREFGREREKKNGEYGKRWSKDDREEKQRNEGKKVKKEAEKEVKKEPRQEINERGRRKAS